MAVIELNGNYYTLAQDERGKAAISQSYVRRLSSAIRTVGVQQRQDDTSVNRYVSPSFPKGIGWHRARRDTGRGVGGLMDSTAWTMRGPVANGKLFNTQSISNGSEGDHLKKYLVYKGNLYAFLEEDYSTGSTRGRVDIFGGADDTWNGGVEVGSNSGSSGFRIFDACVHKASMFYVGTLEGDDTEYEIEYSTGGSWSTASGTGFPTGGGADYMQNTKVRRNAFDDDFGRILSFGNTLVVAVFQDDDSTDGSDNIAIWSSTDSGTNWANDCTLPSGDGPKALVDWYDLGLNRSPVLVTAEGIYSIDLANNAFTLMYALDGDSNNGRWATVGNDGALYFGLGSGSIMRMSLTDSNNLDVMNVGPPGDGLVTDRQGHANMIVNTPSEWLLVAYGGHSADHYASIFAIDTSVILKDEETGKRYMPWHSLYKHSVANLDITNIIYSTADDGVPRLHMALEGASVSLVYHIEYPFDVPTQNTAIQYQASSILRLPDDDLGDPQSDTMLLQAMVDADELDGSTGTGGVDENHIEFRYGINGASDSGTLLGDFLGSQKSLSFGSGAGISAKRIGIKMTLDNANTAVTETPLLHEFELQGQTVYLDKKAWDFTIDIAATARDFAPTVTSGQKAEEVIVTNLEAVAQSATLVTFRSGRMDEVRVRVPNEMAPKFSLRVEDSFLDDTGYRTGFVTMRVEEGI